MDDPNLPWLTDDPQNPDLPADIGRTGVTGQLPWRQNAQGQASDSVGDDGLANIAWQSVAGSGGDPSPDPTKGLTGMLPWNALASDPNDPRALEDSSASMFAWLESTDDPAPPPPAAVIDNLPEWLEDFSLDEEVAAPSIPTLGADVPMWVRDYKPEEDITAGGQAPGLFALPLTLAQVSTAQAPPVEDFSFLGMDRPASADFSQTFSPPQAGAASVDDDLSFLDAFPLDDAVPAQTPPPQAGAASVDDDLSFLDAFPLDDSNGLGGETLLESTTPSAQSTGDLPAWLNTDWGDSQAEPLAETENQASPSEDELDWLALPSEDSPQGFDLDTVGEADLNWMSDNDALTYADWERQQAEQAAPPPLDLPDPDLPDLLSSAPQAGGLSGDFMPDWYVGVEELDTSDAPDWLKEITGVPASSAAPSAPPPAALVDILGDLDATESPIAAPNTGELLDIFGDLNAQVTVPPDPTFDDFFAPPALGDDLPLPNFSAEAPDWLSEAPLPIPTDLPTLTPATSDELPSWFSDTDFSALAPPALGDDLPLPDLTPSGVTDFDLAPPDFDLDSLLGSPNMALATTGPSADLEQLTQFSDDLSFDDSFLQGFSAPSVAAPTANLAPDETFAFPAEEMPAETLAEVEEVPDWLREIAASGDETILSVGGVQERFREVSPLALDPDVRALLEMVGLAATRPKSKRPPEAVGVLAGVEGLAPLPPQADTQLLTIERLYSPSREQQERLAVLQRVLEQVQAETEAQKVEIDYGLDPLEHESVAEADLLPPRKKPRTKVRPKRDRALISLLLLLALFLPFLSQSFQWMDTPAVLDEDGQSLVAAVEALQSAPRGENPPRVLVALEYGPTAAQELDPLLYNMLYDVLAQGAIPVVVSTNPYGVLAARRVLRRAAEQEAIQAVWPPEAPPPVPAPVPPYPPALDRGLPPYEPPLLPQEAPPPTADSVPYQILGYLPQGAVGIQALLLSESSNGFIFGRDARNQPTNLEIGEVSLEDFAFLVVAAERPDEVRLWAEQTTDLALPKYLMVTSAAEPIGRTYARSGSYNGLLAGFGGAESYAQARNLPTAPPSEALPAPQSARRHAVGLGALLAAGLISLGVLFNLLRGARRARRRTL